MELAEEDLTKYEPLCLEFNRVLRAHNPSQGEAMFAVMNVLANVLLQAAPDDRDGMADDIRNTLERMIDAVEAGEVVNVNH
jgi:hypothetical protein